jgi:hypothetical protein
MSNTTPTPQGYAPQPPQGANYYYLPAPQPPKKKATGWIVATCGAAALALVGMVAAVSMAFASPATDGASGIVDHHPDSHHAVIINGGGGNVPNPPHHHVQPSGQVETWQKDLGQLNFYEGPVNGYLTPQTKQAISYLQADAHLPQTGEMNAATQAAMQYMLVHGNNQMGS